MPLYMTFLDRTMTLQDISNISSAERVAYRHPDAILAVFSESGNDDDLDLVLKSSGQDIAFQRYLARLEWQECEESYEVEAPFFAFNDVHARTIANNMMTEWGDPHLDMDVVVFDEEGVDIPL